MHKILVIAGSDSGAGAGIQADLKTAMAFDCYATTAITAVTVQNTLGVEAVHTVPEAIVTGQIQAVLDDIGADVIKTGMLSTAEIIEAVIRALESCDKPLIVDPVMVSTTGAQLMDPEAIHVLKTQLFPKAYLVTPNIPEAEILTGIKIVTQKDMAKAAEQLVQQQGAKHALVKGGHLSGDTLYDVLCDGHAVRIFTHKKIETPHTHGTGCTLASAIACGIAKGQDLERSIEYAIAYVEAAMKTAFAIGKGKGPLNHCVT